MQFVALAVAALAVRAESASGNDTPNPASAPICKKLRRVGDWQSRDRPSENESIGQLRGLLAGGKSGGLHPTLLMIPAAGNAPQEN
jgi:hypothetical protein